jgi:hypothetical protein
MRNRRADEFRTTWKQFCTTPGRKTLSVSPHHDAPTTDTQTACAGEVGRNSPNFAPREKEKNFSGAKIMSLSRH